MSIVTIEIIVGIAAVLSAVIAIYQEAKRSNGKSLIISRKGTDKWVEISDPEDESEIRRAAKVLYS